MPTFPAESLRKMSEAIFVAAGASQANAARVTEAMIKANLAGHDSHGVQHVPGYVKRVEQGQIKAAGTPRILRETATTALMSGGWTFGHVGAGQATQLAIAKAQQHQIAAVSLVEADHIGRLGEYGEMGEAAGIIVIALTGTGQKTAAQVPFGGREKLLGTNPIAMGFPAGEHPGVVLDFATTVVAAGKLAVAQAKGQPVAPGMLIDAEGRPTTDPSILGKGGAMLPFGGHKGYALALAVELLGRVLGGGEAHAAGNTTPLAEAGSLFIAIDPGAFRPAAEYAASAAALIDRVSTSAPAEGFSEVMVPGEPERRSRQQRGQAGIPLPDATWQELVATANRFGVAVPTP